MVKINFGEQWHHVAAGQQTDAKKDKTEKKCDCYLLSDSSTAFFFLLPDLKEGMKGLFANQMVNSLLSQLPALTQVVVLRELYKTAYTGPPEDIAQSGSRLSLVTHRTSHLTPAQVDWLNKHGKPAHFTIMTGGISARLLTHCEMYGIAGFAVTAITDSHYVSSESMQCYSEIFSSLGLNSGHFDVS